MKQKSKITKAINACLLLWAVRINTIKYEKSTKKENKRMENA